VIITRAMAAITRAMESGHRTAAANDRIVARAHHHALHVIRDSSGHAVRSRSVAKSFSHVV
jgi:hypothetical protein